MGETPIAKSPVLYLCTQLFHTFIVYFDPECGFFWPYVMPLWNSQMLRKQ